MWLPIILTFQGLLLALTPMIAQHFGAGHRREVTQVTLQGAYLAGALALLIFLLMQFIAIPVGMMQMDDMLRQKALDYMGFRKGESLLEKPINYVFIGSCTNSRIEDFRIAAQYINGKQKAAHVNALIVPGSQQVAKQIQEEGLTAIFEKAGFDTPKGWPRPPFFV